MTVDEKGILYELRWRCADQARCGISTVVLSADRRHVIRANAETEVRIRPATLPLPPLVFLSLALRSDVSDVVFEADQPPPEPPLRWAMLAWFTAAAVAFSFGAMFGALL
jgi:hypothetical protein